MKKGILLGVLLLATCAFSGTAYPSGTFSYGQVVGVMAFEQGYVRFVVNGTMGNGQSGGENFWIDLGKSGANAQLATVLSAYSTGSKITVWHYGTDFSYGGQGGYTQGFVYTTSN